MKQELPSADQAATSPQPSSGQRQVGQSVAVCNSLVRSVRRTVLLHDISSNRGKTPANRTLACKKIIRDVKDAIQSKAKPDARQTVLATASPRDLARVPATDIKTLLKMLGRTPDP